LGINASNTKLKRKEKRVGNWEPYSQWIEFQINNYVKLIFAINY
jgi:hypothetical protein